VKTTKRAKRAQPAAYLFNGQVLFPDRLTDEQKKKAVPLYTKAAPKEQLSK
jgi:hypothetical protein